MKKLAGTILFIALFTAGYALGGRGAPLVAEVEAAPAADRVYELRTYTTHEGRLEALHQRFRNHTLPLFQKHGITSVAYWVPEDSARAGNTLVFLLSYPSREAARASWDAFRTDPEWVRARAASEEDGPIVQHIESVYAHPTDYSPMR